MSLADELRKQKRSKQARLVEHMADKESDTYQEIAENVHGDDTATEKAIIMNMHRTNDSLNEMKSRLSFKAGGGKVHREISPE
jgi:hypothetical protein